MLDQLSGQPDKADPVYFEVTLPFFVRSLSSRVYAAIYFDGQTHFVAIEIQDKWPGGMLAPELVPKQATIA